MDKEEIQAQPTREEVKQEMLDHLQEKYGEEFECQSIEYKSWSQSGYEHMFAYPKGGNPKNNFAIYRYDEGECYEDGYVGLLMKDNYYEIVDDIIKKYFEENTVNINYKYVYPDSFNSKISFEKFLEYANKKNNITISIYVQVEDGFSEERLGTLFGDIKNEIEKTISIAFLSISCYLREGYREDIEQYSIENPEEDTFPTNNRIMEKFDSWGQIDFDYEYKEGE